MGAWALSARCRGHGRRRLTLNGRARARTGRGVEQRELELEPQPADSAPLGIDGAQSVRRGGQRRGTIGVAGRTDGGGELGPDLVENLVQDHGDVAAAVVELGQDRDAGTGVTIDQRAGQAPDGVGIGQAQEVADGGLVDRRAGRREHLVEDRLGVAHPAGGKPGDEAQCGGLGRHGLRRQDPLELALDLLDRQTANVEPLEARQDRRREVLGVGRREHERDELRRLLERLQEGVPGVLRDLVSLVEDVDLAAQVRRGVLDPLAQVADRIDAAVARGVDLDEIHRPAFADRDARLARVARIAVLEVRAVEGLGQDPGEGRLAGPARPDEQDRMRYAVGADRVPERLDDGRLADDLGEGLGTPAAVERLMGRRRHLGGRRRRGAGPRRRCRGRGSGRAHVAPVRGRLMKVPCTHRRPVGPRALHDERLGPGRSAAPDEDRLVLLPSGPDTVRGSSLRGTRSSTSLEAAACKDAVLGWEFSPAGADCRFRAPLVPRLARPGQSSRDAFAGGPGTA